MKALYSLYNALVSINVPADKAQAVVDANQAFLKQHIDASVELLRSSMTVRLGSMMVVPMSLLFAALKLT